MPEQYNRNILKKILVEVMQENMYIWWCWDENYSTKIDKSTRTLENY